MTQSLQGDFNPAVHFLGLLKKALGDGMARRCSMVGGPQIVIAPRQNAFFSASITSGDLRVLCQAQPFDLQIEALPSWNPEAEQETIQVGRMRLRSGGGNASAGLEPRPLSELLWLASICASNGRLLQGCRADDPVRLKHWPELSCLSSSESYLQIAQFMHANSADLATVAKRVGVALGEVHDFHNACAVLGLIERGNVFETDDYFLGIIQQSLRDGLTRRCTLPHLAPLFLAPKESRYYACNPSDMDNLAAYFSASPSNMSIDLVATADLGKSSESEEETIQIGRVMMRRKKENQPPTLTSRPLDELIWRATMKTSRGRLLAGKRSEDVVRLRRWPDFSRLAEYRNMLPLAAFMSINAASLPTIAKYTRLPIEQVFDFHNVCAILDYLEYLPEERLQNRPVSDPDLTTYRTISKSLGGIRAGKKYG